MAREFVYKSISQETRSAYTRGIRDFFAFVDNLHPIDVTPAHVQAYRDSLISRGRKPATVATRLSVIRSFFAHLHDGGHIPVNPAATKLVKPPKLGQGGSGRALKPKEVRNLLAGPDRSKPEGARDYALLLIMLRLALRLAEVVSLKLSSMSWDGERWVLRCKIKGGAVEAWPLPGEVKRAIDDYLNLDRARRRLVNSDGEDAYIFQPHSNYRTLVYARALSRRHVERIVAHWGDFTGVGHLTPHDLRRTAVTKLLNDGCSYREVQMVTKHRDPKTVMRYDKQRENLGNNPVNFLSYED